MPQDEPQRQRLDRTLVILEGLDGPSFPLALAALLCLWVDPAGAVAVARRWRLSNRQTLRAAWLIEHRGVLPQALAMPWSRVQRLFIADGIHELVALEEALARAESRDPGELACCRTRLLQPPEVLNPPPLVTGDDRIRHGIHPGPSYHVLLERVRNAQLDGEIRTRQEALDLVDCILRTEP